MSIKPVLRYLLAVAVSYVVAVFFVSLLNSQAVVSLGYAVTLSQRFDTLAHDLVGMTELYLPIISVALLIAFLVTRYLIERWVSRSVWLYALAGFVALATVHILLKLIFEVSAIAPTATMVGLFSQCLAGALGGWVYAHFAKQGET